MELNKVNGNTYYIDNPTNIGVYLYKNKYCMMVDTGIDNGVGARVGDVLQREGIKPKYIVNTHSHIDHAGADLYFKERYPGAVFFASSGESIFIEDDYLFPAYLYGAAPIKELKRKRAKRRGVSIDEVVEPGPLKINGEKFEVLSLKGHSIDQIGIATADGVCFLEDSLYSGEIAEKYPFPLYFDVEDQLETIDYIKGLDFDYYVLSHGEGIRHRDGIMNLADDNRRSIERCLDDIMTLLSQPLTREDVLEQISVLYELKPDFRDYYLCLSSAGAFIAYLYNHDLLDFQVENGKLYYYMK